MVGQKVGPMLKITIHEAAGPLRIELEGRLAGAWVCELEHGWLTAQARHPNRPLAVELRWRRRALSWNSSPTKQKAK
jgi:hypothetical protein